MHRKLLAATSALLIAMPLTGLAADATRDVSKVAIELTSFGLGGSGSESFELVPKGGDFTLSGFTTETRQFSDKKTRIAIKARMVKGDRVRALAAALAAPVVSRADGIGQLTSPQWLDAHATSAYDTLVSNDGGACSADARALFMTRYKNKNAAVTATNAYYDTQWTDDYPSAKVSITYADGSTKTVESHSQQALMLPWKAESGKTWNPAIANALAAVLPASSDYATRLLPTDLVDGMAREVVAPIEDQWEDLEGRCLYAPIIAKLTPHFDVKRVFHTGPEMLSATLHNRNMPPNLVIDVRLPGGEPRASKAAFDRFMRLAPAYIEVARPFVTANPSINFELWFSEGHSFNFEDDEVYGDDAAVEFLRKQPRRDESVLLRQRSATRGREWVVLPNGKSVMWKEER